MMSRSLLLFAWLAGSACVGTVDAPQHLHDADDSESDDDGASDGDNDTNDNDSNGSDWDYGDADGRPSPMPVISHDVPAFASSGDAGPAHDGAPATAWHSTSLPGWLAYDLSSVDDADRQTWLVALYAIHAADYLTDSVNQDMQIPTDYTIELNQAAGGGSPPSDGWSNVVTVSDNTRSVGMHLVNAASANWLRVSVSGSTHPSAVGIDVDVHSAPNGGSDAWLFMGDSITFMNTTYAFSDIPSRVAEAAPERWPAIIPAARGGTNTVTALEIIDESMNRFPGRFVVLAYGTNDGADNFKMEELVQAVLAADKIPVIPRMPWSDNAGIQEKAPIINAAIDALYEEYPEILRGPDLWTAFTNRTDLIPTNDVHPNGAGGVFLREQWAAALTAMGVVE